MYGIVLNLSGSNKRRKRQAAPTGTATVLTKEERETTSGYVSDKICTHSRFPSSWSPFGWSTVHTVNFHCIRLHVYFAVILSYPNYGHFWENFHGHFSKLFENLEKFTPKLTIRPKVHSEHVSQIYRNANCLIYIRTHLCQG